MEFASSDSEDQLVSMLNRSTIGHLELKRKVEFALMQWSK